MALERGIYPVPLTPSDAPVTLAGRIDLLEKIIAIIVNDLRDIAQQPGLPPEIDVVCSTVDDIQNMMGTLLQPGQLVIPVDRRRGDRRGEGSRRFVGGGTWRCVAEEGTREHAAFRHICPATSNECPESKLGDLVAMAQEHGWVILFPYGVKHAD